jgi:hypothetical protein
VASKKSSTKKSIGYLIVEAPTKEELMGKVVDLVKSGWKLQGGAFALRGIFHQTLIK